MVRNYLEHTVESIQTWLKMKEAEYKAAQMSKEAANLQKDEEEKQKQMEKADKKGKRSPQRCKYVLFFSLSFQFLPI